MSTTTLTVKPSGFLAYTHFTYDVMIITSINQTDEELTKSLKKVYRKKADIQKVVNLVRPDTTNAVALCNWHEAMDVCVMRFFKPLDTPHRMSAVAHEVLHAVSYILKSRGLKFTQSSEEAYAYLTSELNYQVLATVIS